MTPTYPSGVIDLNSPHSWPSRGVAVTYCFEDSEGRSLYLGSTSHLARRASEHMNAAPPWWRRAVRVKWRACSDRAHAYRFERKLIERLKPPFNDRAMPWEELTHADLEAVVHRAKAQKRHADALISMAERFMDTFDHFGHAKTLTVREMFGDDIHLVLGDLPK